MALLQASWVHVYLSYPFVLGWSLLEAMACGCCIVGSRGMPVEEAIEHNVEGRLIPMDQPGLLAKEVLQLLADPDSRARFGSCGEETRIALRPAAHTRSDDVTH